MVPRPPRHDPRGPLRHRHGVGWVSRTVDQSAARGSWLSLGTYALATEVAVRLGARTGDPAGSGRTVAVDALRFVPRESPPPPVISDIDVVAQHDRAVVRFSLDAKGPARTEYRLAGAVDWRLGAEETGSQYADHRQVIDGLRPETDYELRVIASNAGGRTVSDIVRFTHDRAAGPRHPRHRASSPRRDQRRGAASASTSGVPPAPSTVPRARATGAWGPRSRAVEYANHRMVLDGLRPETRYELRVVASNDGGTTISDVVRFRTDLRTVDCTAGDSLEAAIDAARSGDTLRIRWHL